MADDSISLHSPDADEAAAAALRVRLPASPKPEPRETSGITSLLLISYLERVAGRAALEDVLRRAGVADREAELRDESTWFSFETKIRLFEAMAEVLDDPLATRRMGEAALELQGAPGLKVALRGLGSPRLVYKNVVRANAKFSARHVMELSELRATSARMSFRDLTGGQIHPLDCQYTQGLLACVPALFGLPKARINHPHCGARSGSGPCTYNITWEPAHTRTLVMSALAGVAALGGSALISPMLIPLGAGAAVGAAGFAGAAALRARRARWRQLEAELEDNLDNGERLFASLKDLVSELRLDEVLAKITSNARDAVGGKEFALLVDEPDGLRCQSSSGLPIDVVAALEAWARSDPDGFAEPVLVDDVGIVPALAELPAHPRMSVGSLCAAPLAYRGRTLGLLIALSTRRLTFLPRDVDQLQAYATQAAIALENARLYEAQEALASRDALTGLRNHRYFHERMAEELDRLRRQDGRLAVLLVDLDGFKSVNDESGHAAGDRVLCDVARRIERACRSSDVAFRIGGDEFAVILPGADREQAQEVADRVASAVGLVDARTTASVGVAVWPDDGGSKDVLLAHADGGLYAAKAQKDVSRPPEPIRAAERRLAVVNRLAHRLTGLLDPAEICGTTVRQLDRSLGYVMAGVLRLDGDEILRMQACAGPLTRETSLGSWEQSVHEGVNGRVARTGEPALVGDTGLDPDHLGIEPLNGDSRTRLRSQLAVPICVGERVWGVLNLEDTRLGAFDADDLLLLEAVSAHVGAALHRSELHAGLEDAFTTTLAVLCDALEAKDLYTAGHADDVAKLAVAVARRLGMNEATCRQVGYAGLMHDVGKVAVRTEVLTKPGPLDAVELEGMKQHVVVGAQMLERIPFLADVAPLVRSSHEHWDGSGYPDGLAGAAIPAGARVIAVCDAWHAMTSDRPYRAALPNTEAAAELQRHAGSQFDPAAVEALLAELGKSARR